MGQSQGAGKGPEVEAVLVERAGQLELEESSDQMKSLPSTSSKTLFGNQ